MVVSTSFFEQLVGSTEELHAQIMAHPMVRGIGAGSLPEETFRFYIEQDFQYLLRYMRVHALAASSTDDLDEMLQFSKLVYTTVELEIAVLRDLYRRFGGDPEHLEAVTPAPTCVAYTNHLQATALELNVFVTLAAILPCQWGYREIARNLKAAGMPEDQRFAAWIEGYTSDEFGEFVDWAIERFNALADKQPQRYLDAARNAFELSARYELRFWQMAWTQESWDLPAS